MLLGVGAKKKTYVDDVFSTYLFKANGSTGQTINNGINLSGKGGLVWHKDRDATYNHVLWDTVRGDDVVLRSDTDAANATVTNGITFNSNGYSVNSAQGNESTNDTSSWTFRKAPGFFDVVTYTGNGTAGRTVSHNLGSVPGFIAIKCTSDADHWCCYHKSRGGTKFIALDLNYAESTNSNGFNDTTPTSTEVTLGVSGRCNGNGKTYVMYLFAGGESTAATARSVEFGSGANDLLHVGSSSDLSFGTGDFTIEGWFREETESNMGLFQISSSSDGFTQSDFSNTIALGHNSGGWNPYGNGQTSTPSSKLHLNYSEGQWIHFAYTRESGTNRIFINGDLLKDWSSSYNYTHTYLAIGTQYLVNNRLDGKISNFRIVKGTAVYTSAFKPPTEPLTNITNTVLLCCNNSSVTGATVTPTTITTEGGGGLTALTDSPFDDPAAFTFGDSGSESVISTGSYVGSGSAGLEVNLGWEPQWLLIKRSNDSEDWMLFDSMRGLVTGGNDLLLRPNDNSADTTTIDWLDLTPTGFKLKSTYNHVNNNGDTYIYLAIRRSDGYVGKQYGAGEGTSVFAMDTGSGNSTIPAFDSGFPVDFALMRQPATSESWYTGARLTGGKYLKTDSSSAQNNGIESNWVFDSNTGWIKSYSESYQSWMWKRGQGFDCICFKGDGVAGRQIRHSLSKSPEMIWLKTRSVSTAQNWMVGHKGLNGGTNPWEKYINLNTSGSENDYPVWNDQAPTSTHFSLGTVLPQTNNNNETYIAMLFASTDVSAVGSYIGTGSSGLSVSTGFQPRFLIIKRADASSTNWLVFDSVRGFSSGNDSVLYVNTSGAAVTNTNWGAFTSTGFTINETYAEINNNTGKYIYYAHA